MNYHIPDDVRHTILKVVLVLKAKHAGRALDKEIDMRKGPQYGDRTSMSHARGDSNLWPEKT